MHIPSHLPPAWTQLRPHPKQSAAWHSNARFVNLACGRGSGKTEIARRKIVMQLPIRKPWSNPLYFYALPTYNQARRVAWKPLLDLIPPSWIDGQPNISDMRIDTIFGSTLYIVGLDQPQRLEGSQYDFGVIDEACDQKTKVFDLSIRPALSHRAGCCWRIGVPKRYGIGALEFKNVFDIGLIDNDVDMESYCWPSADILPGEEVEAARRQLDPQDFAEQYEASWISAGGLLYYNFTESLHTSGVLGYNPNLPIYVGMDFNVDPMSWVLGHIVGTTQRELHIFDEIRMRNTHTPETLTELYNRHGDHVAGFIFTGDASSRARKLSAAITDYGHIANDRRFKNKRVYISRRNPPVNDRLSAVNALFENAAGDRRLFIAPKCRALLQDMRNMVYKEGTRIVDESNPELGHMADALGYLVWRNFPVHIARSDSKSRIITHKLNR